MKFITDSQAQEAMRAKEFPNEIINSAARVAIILTQGWCSQWHIMERFLNNNSFYDNVYVYIYDQSPLFQEFMDFKEKTFDNELVPYIRYYKDGHFAASGNYASEEEFQEKLA